MGKPGKLDLMSIETIRRELRAIKDAIATAHIAVNEGVGVDLATLQDSVKSVCNEIEELPGLVGRNEIEQLIKSVVMDFDALTQALATQHQNLNANEVPGNNYYSDTSAIRNKDDDSAGNV